MVPHGPAIYLDYCEVGFKCSNVVRVGMVGLMATQADLFIGFTAAMMYCLLLLCSGGINCGLYFID